MKNENEKKDKDRFLYYLYLGLWSNLDYMTQVERVPLTFKEFSAEPDKGRLIDLVKTMIYNKRE